MERAGLAVDQSQYANRVTVPDFTGADCPDMPRGLEQVEGNLYRHTSGPGLAVHSGLVLITKEGALVIDPAATCTALQARSPGWSDEERVEMSTCEWTHVRSNLSYRRWQA